MLTKLLGGLAITSGLIIAGVVANSPTNTSEAGSASNAAAATAAHECCEKDKECCTKDKECCETEKQCSADKAGGCEKSSAAGNGCGAQKSECSKNECCSKDCCEGCPDCNCECPCCENCAEGCECPNMAD